MLKRKKGLILWGLFGLTVLTAINARANTILDIEQLRDNINAHPDVIGKLHDITSSHLNVLQIQSDDSVKLNFSTNSNASIKSNVSPLNGRANNTSDDYIDGVFTLNASLYDFGKNKASVNAGKEQQKVSELIYIEAFETTLFKLFSLSVDYHNMLTLEKDLIDNHKELVKGIHDLRMQYTAGIGTMTDIRETQISQIDLETELHSVQLKKKEIVQTLDKEFSIDETQIKQIADYANNVHLKTTEQGIDSLIAKNKNPVIQTQRTNQISAYTTKAIHYDIASIKAADKPQVTTQVKAIAYDLTRGSDEYNVYAGINISLPLFDGGSSDVKIQTAQHNLRVQKDMLKSTQTEKQSKLNTLISKQKDLLNKFDSSNSKKEKLEERLKNVELRAKTFEGGSMPLIKAKLQLNKLNRDIQSYQINLVKNNLEYLQLSENLLEISQINPALNKGDL